MKIVLRNGLPYVTATLIFQDRQIELENVLLDTGSAGTVFSTDKLAQIGLEYEPSDLLYTIRGIGGGEFVFVKRLDGLKVAQLAVEDFEIEASALDYGFEINGVLGTDFLTTVGAVIDLASMEVLAATPDD
jgi:hypothetical protein